MDEDARVDTEPTESLSPLQTEFEFTLPCGYVDEAETLHREGKMRLATAADEIVPLKDPRVRANESYLTVILLSRVVTSLGTVDDVTTHVVEKLFVSDLAYLQDLYERINARGADVVDTVCPGCGEAFEAVVDPDSPDRAQAHSHGPADTAADADRAGSRQRTPETDVSSAGRSRDDVGRSDPSIRVGRPVRGEAGVGSGNSGGDAGSDQTGTPDPGGE